MGNGVVSATPEREAASGDTEPHGIRIPDRKKRVQVTKAVGAWQPQTPPPVPTGEAQYMIYDLYESYYQSVYNTVRSLQA